MTAWREPVLRLKNMVKPGDSWISRLPPKYTGEDEERVEAKIRLPATLSRGTQTEILIVSDAAVGDSSARLAEVGVQASCGLRGTPIKLKKRKRRSGSQMRPLIPLRRLKGPAAGT